MWRVHLLMLQCYFSWQAPCLIFQELRLTHPQVLPSHDHISNTLKPNPGLLQSLKLRWFTRWSDGKKKQNHVFSFFVQKVAIPPSSKFHVRDPSAIFRSHRLLHRTASCATGSSPSQPLPFASPRKADENPNLPSWWYQEAGRQLTKVGPQKTIAKVGERNSNNYSLNYSNYSLWCL